MHDAAPIVRAIGRTPAETLAAVAPGSGGIVKGIEGLAAADRVRLLELGFVEGTQVAVVRRAPLGDPIEVALRGYRLSLRASDARAIRLQHATPEFASHYIITTSSDRPAPVSAAGAVVALMGNPNCGKSTLFNSLSGADRATGNYPGITVTRGARDVTLGSGVVTLVDLPGCYSLIGRSADEDVAALELFGDHPAQACVVVLDSTALARSLYLALTILELGRPTVCVLNMSDEARAQGIVIDDRALADLLGVEIVRTVATKGEGLDTLLAAIDRAITLGGSRRVSFGRALDARIGGDARTTWTLEKSDRSFAESIIRERYGFVDRIVARAVRSPDTPRRSLTDRIDTLLTNPLTGTLVLLSVLAIVFNLLFTASQPLMDGIEGLFSWLSSGTKALLPVHWASELVADGVIGGVGTVLIFVPQIALLLFFMTFLESFGYLSRAAFLIDRLMRAVGLNGKAFVPMLGGYACAVPAILSLRTLENRRDRLLTMAVLPLMSCSARLPVYTLIIATLYPATLRWLGMPVSAWILLGLYLASAVVTLLAASVIGRTVFAGESPSLVLELPPYRLPKLRLVLKTVWLRMREFLTTAGTTIVVLSVVLWLLLHFPRIEQATETQQLEYSLGGRLGHAIEPVIAPLGFDWRIGIGLIGSFAAREVFVATMGVIHGADGEDTTKLTEALQNAKRKDGRPIYTPRTGFALLAFFMIACQCMSTLATIRRETRSWRFTAGVFAYMTVLAYVVALAINQIGAAL